MAKNVCLGRLPFFVGFDGWLDVVHNSQLCAVYFEEFVDVLGVGVWETNDLNDFKNAYFSGQTIENSLYNAVIIHKKQYALGNFGGVARAKCQRVEPRQRR